eukprot:TRINITY_DN56705_c0_g1_i1.p1 TRINITY_DN56705_c0_g1~~TRINITY_DN56705_c0_g1_i1.p1  ORF type:complete len:339 (+),score=34.95 TRINITY_DN56705_c0_g1_i1:193-1209(+)
MVAATSAREPPKTNCWTKVWLGVGFFIIIVCVTNVNIVFEALFVLLLLQACFALLLYLSFYVSYCICGNSTPRRELPLVIAFFGALSLFLASLLQGRPGSPRDHQEAPLGWLSLYSVIFAILFYAAHTCWVFVTASPIFWASVGQETTGVELEQLRILFAERCEAWGHKYNFDLELVKAYRVKSPDLEDKFDAFRESLRERKKVSDCRTLFHGTSSENARRITSTGFSLPNRRGMFGKGVYFADCPLKSWQYCPWPGAMLVCEVELGNSKHARSAGCEPATDLKRSWFGKLVGRRSFDSLTAATGPFGCVRVPEYVIYNSHQAVPRHVLQLQQKPKPR